MWKPTYNARPEPSGWQCVLELTPRSRFATVRVFVLALFVLLLNSGCRGQNERIEGGQAYLGQCAVCHGVHGAGDGPLAAEIAQNYELMPGPVNTPQVQALGRKGIESVIDFEGHLRKGSTMPPWGPHLGEVWRVRIADYLLALPDFGDSETAKVSEYLADVEGTPSGARRDYVLYCSGCHGPYGEGDGFFSPQTGEDLRPVNLIEAGERLGETALLEVIRSGGAHAPEAPAMPGWIYDLPPEMREGLAAYVLSLSERAE